MDLKIIIALIILFIGYGFIGYSYRNELIATFRYDSSPIDWCEENYVYSEYISEFWNTISSFSLIVMAFVAPSYLSDNVEGHEPNMWMLWTLLVFVGIGSILFHGTLSIAGQILDELPICLLGIFAMFMLKPLKRWNPSLRRFFFEWPFFVGFTTGSILLCLIFPVLSHVFVLSFIPIVVYHFLVEYFRASEATKRQVKPVFGTTIILFFLAFGSWLIDKFLCYQVQRWLGGFNPQLHAWWHVFVSLTFWGCVTTGIVLRANGDGLKVHLTASGGLLPLVDITKSQ